jgi:hypothetical protein
MGHYTMWYYTQRYNVKLVWQSNAMTFFKSLLLRKVVSPSVLKGFKPIGVPFNDAALVFSSRPGHLPGGAPW